MTDSRERIVDALSAAMTRGEAEKELRELGKKIHAISLAVEVIYRALGRWTGQELKPGNPVPIVRDGKVVGSIGAGLFGKDVVREVAEASLTELRAELLRKRDDLQALVAAIGDLNSSLSKMTGLELSRLEQLTGNIHHNALRGPKAVEERIIREIGSVFSALISCGALLSAAKEEIGRLDGELEKRNAGQGRPRNEAAHEVALRLAKLYARVTGKRPTYAAGPDGLSGDYTPVLREVFDALGWKKTDLRGPATKAIEAITEADLRHEESTLDGLISALSRD